MLGIRVCSCGLTNFPRIPFLAYRTLVVAVFIIHMTANVARPSSARARTHARYSYACLIILASLKRLNLYRDTKAEFPQISVSVR